MKLLKTAFTLAALVLCTSAQSSTDVAFQQVLDRNANTYIAKGDHDNRLLWSGKIRTFDTIKMKQNDATENLMSADARLFLDAIINDWTLAHVALGTEKQAALDKVSFQESYVTIGNLNRNPLYVRAGYGNIPFGLYNVDEINNYHTTNLTKQTATHLNLGFADASGVFGNVYLFKGKVSKIETKKNEIGVDVNELKDKKLDNFGVSLGYCMSRGNQGIRVALDWIYNLDTLFNDSADFNADDNKVGDNFGYKKAVNGWHLGLTGHYNQFDMRFNGVMYKLEKDITYDKKDQWRFVFGIGAGVNFNLGSHATRFGLDFERKMRQWKDAKVVDNNISTFYLGMNVEVVKNVHAGINYGLEHNSKGDQRDDKGERKAHYEHIITLSLTAKLS